jgi:hypothetical protein
MPASRSYQVAQDNIGELGVIAAEWGFSCHPAAAAGPCTHQHNRQWPRRGVRAGERTRPGKAKLALDFLLRPAKMTWHQHTATKLSIRRGKPARRRQYHCCVGGDHYGSCSCAGCSAPRDTNRRWHRPEPLGTMSSRGCSAKNSPCFASPAREQGEHQQMIVETTCCIRQNVRMR